MKRHQLIEQLIVDTQVVKEAVATFAALPIDLLSMQPAVDHWSVLQCIEHLNIADEHYLHQFDLKLNKAEHSTIETFKPGFLGKKLTTMMKPTDEGKIPSPMKTIAKFRPDIDVKYDTIDKFLTDQDKIVEYLLKAKTLDLNKNKIPSALGSFITFKLGDAFRFLIAHNQRHVQQMRNILTQISTLKTA